MNSHKILKIASQAGKIILESGGEIYRVEETIIRICKAFGAKEVEPFVMPTGIVISIIDSQGNSHSIVKRVTERKINLEKIHLVNNLSRKIVNNHYPAKEVEKELLEISKIKGYDVKVQIFFSAIITGFFTFLYKGNAKDFIAAFIIGMLIRIIIYALYNLKLNTFFVNIIGGATATLGGIFFSSLNLCDNLNIVIISSMMLLVPGLIITNSIRDTIAGDLVSGITRAMEGLFIAAAIAIGSGLVFKLWLLYGGIL